MQLTLFLFCSEAADSHAAVIQLKYPSAAIFILFRKIM